MSHPSSSRVSSWFVALFLTFGLNTGAAQTLAEPGPSAASALALSGPFTYENLTVFLVHDPKAADAHEDVLTLEEALAARAVEVHETGDVNQLRVSNKGDKPVYLQSGDIVKGGKQDRALQHDTLLPPKAKRVAIGVFCVESGRWRGRGQESTLHFSSSSSALSTKKQRLAAKSAASQQEVWAGVAQAQADLERNLGRPVKAAPSATSLQLSLESEAVTAARSRFEKALEAQFPPRQDAVGYAFAVNGEVNSVDVYGSPALFRKMRGKLICASAVEAVASRGQKPGAPVSEASVRALLVDADKAVAKSEVRAARTHVVRQETNSSVVFTAEDPSNKKTLHKNYIKK